MDIWLEIQSEGGERQFPLTGDRVTIGRSEQANLPIPDNTLSRLHSSIHREGDRLWVLDEGSANGTYVNDETVPSNGTPLTNGDVIRLGESVRIVVRFGKQEVDQKAKRSKSENGLPRLALIIAVVLVIGFLIGIAALGARILITRAEERERREAQQRSETSDDEPLRRSFPPSPTPSVQMTINHSEEQTDSIPSITLYKNMSNEQKYDFLDRRARHIAGMMGNRESVFDKEVIGHIKHYVDAYANRVGNGSTVLWGEDLNSLFARATKYAPFIIAAFRKEAVPTVIGLYIPVIESEYHTGLRSPVGALGMFQFMPATAIEYQVSPADRTDPVKMAPAAARYMKDRIREFGPDANSVALSIAGYNRSARSVRRDLQDVVGRTSNDRSFWTLLANKEELDHYFQNENVKYVPKFFATAIVGETPAAFGLRIRKLSTYDQKEP